MTLEKFLQENAVLRSDIYLLSKASAKEFMNLLNSKNAELLGINAFFIFEEGIQPSFNDSIDYTSDLIPNKFPPMFFLQQSSDDLHFEMVYEENS